jgi:hypothetical protein
LVQKISLPWIFSVCREVVLWVITRKVSCGGEAKLKFLKIMVLNERVSGRVEVVVIVDFI